LLRVALNAGDKGVREGVGLGALVNGLDDDDLKRQSVSGMFGGACADCGSRVGSYFAFSCLTSHNIILALSVCKYGALWLRKCVVRYHGRIRARRIESYLLACISATADDGNTADLKD